MSLIELACRDASCAPPPTGTGGSSPAITTSSGSELYAAVKRLEADGAITPSTQAPLTSGPEDLFRGMSRTDFVDSVLDYGGNVNSIELRPHVTKGVVATQQYLKDRFGEGARVILFRGTDTPEDPFRETMQTLTPYANLRSDALREGLPPSGITSWTAIRSLAEGYGKTVSVAAVPIDRIMSWDWVGAQADPTMLGYEVIVGSTDGVRKAAAGEFPAMERLRPTTTASALIELACHDESCAPPPTGTGGSSPDGVLDDVEDLPEGFVTDAEDAARRVFEFEFTDRGGRKFIAKTDNVEESDAGVVTIEGTIFAPVPIGGGRLRQHAVGYFTRQVDGWRMHHDSLSIMPQHQGKGIGSAFIAESMRRAADEGVTLVSTSALSTKTSNGVYTWLRAGFDTPTGMVTARTTRNKLGARYRTAGDDTLATRLRGRNPVSTADLLASPVAKQALGGMPEGGNAVQMELQMDISDLRTEAALAASIFTDWVERAITFTLAEDETWYEPIHELTAAGCQDASCAPPPVGTGGSKSVSVYHLTDDPKFAPRADFVPEDNTVAIRERTNPGLYVAKGTWDVERWINGSGYLRPYVAEITVPEDAMVDERWGGEGFIPGDKLDQATVKRLVPVDAFAREVYGDYGWVEDTLGTKFDTGEPVPGDRERYSKGGRPTDYVYDGPDVRDMPEAETKRLAKDAEKALGIRTGTTASADPFAGLEVYGFACHDASCAPPPVGTGGSTPGTDGVPGIADQAAYDQYRSTTNNVQLLDVETAAYAQQQVQDAEVVVRIDADRLSDIVNYSEPDDWELRSMHDPENEVGRSLRGEEYLQHRDLYDAAVGLDMGYVVHGYSEAEFSLEPIQADDDPNPFAINHRVSPQAATWYGEIQLVMTDEARDDATFTIADSLNSGSVPLPVRGPIDPRAAALNGVHPFQMGRDYVEVQLRAPIELSSKHIKEIRVPDLYYLQDVAHVLADRMPDTLVTIEDDGIQMSMQNAVKALEEMQS